MVVPLCQRPQPSRQTSLRVRADLLGLLGPTIGNVVAPIVASLKLLLYVLKIPLHPSQAFTSSSFIKASSVTLNILPSLLAGL